MVEQMNNVDSESKCVSNSVRMNCKLINTNIYGKGRRRWNWPIILIFISICVLLIYVSGIIKASILKSVSIEHPETNENQADNQTESSNQNVNVISKVSQNNHSESSVSPEKTTEKLSERTTEKPTVIASTTERVLISQENMRILQQSVIDSAREKIAVSMEKFPYTEKMIGLSSLTPETNGNPLRSVILSTWRSGSSFFGDIMNAIPGTFYHFEPLMHFGDIQMRHVSNEALNTVHQLLTCNYTGQHSFLNSVMWHYNPRIWQFCDAFEPFQLCRDLDFLNRFCNVFPFQTLKEVRLRAVFVEPLLMDKELNVKVVLLVRDPRAVTLSRSRESWCLVGHECKNSTNVCIDMVADFVAAQYLTKNYPDRFTVVRYEDLALKPFSVTRNILKFYGFPFHRAVRKFLGEHTRINAGDSMSTFRNSTEAAFSWLRNMTFAEINEIQSHCKQAMNLWGYNLVEKEIDLYTAFNPLTTHSLSSHNTQNKHSRYSNRI